MFTAIDHALMARALRLAERGLTTTQPNPRVGCVIANGDEVIGEGWHQRAGEAHAEVLALRAAGERARGATAYVTLEPCGKHGRTPPCAEALIAAGIARVVIASDDAFQRGAGAIGRLRAAGIVVDETLMYDAARELNRGFFSRVERGRPWVRVKLATTLDGRTALANGESKWITGEPARADVQRWRAQSSAILTGAGTATADDPHLTVRSRDGATHPGEGEFQPLRVVLDTRLRLPPTAHLFDGSAPTLRIHANDVDANGIRAGDVRAGEQRVRVECAAVEMRDGRLDLSAVMTLLAARGVNELQVEAGPTLCGALFEHNLVDEWLVYIAPTLLGDTAKPLLVLAPFATIDARPRFRVVDRRQVGEDTRLLLRQDTLH